MQWPTNWPSDHSQCGTVGQRGPVRPSTGVRQGGTVLAFTSPNVSDRADLYLRKHARSESALLARMNLGWNANALDLTARSNGQLLFFRRPSMANDDSKNSPTSDGKKQSQDDAHRDPLSGRAGAHPVGTGVGAAAGGVAAGTAAGAAIGTVAGPVGTAVGAAAARSRGQWAGAWQGRLSRRRSTPRSNTGSGSPITRRGLTPSGGRATISTGRPISTAGNPRRGTPASRSTTSNPFWSGIGTRHAALPPWNGSAQRGRPRLLGTREHSEVW